MRWILYRWLMRVAHHYNWHYAPPCYPDGDILYWCKWCGMRDVMGRGGKLWQEMPVPNEEGETQ